MRNANRSDLLNSNIGTSVGNQPSTRKPKIDAIGLETGRRTLLAVLIMDKSFQYFRAPTQFIMRTYRCVFGTALCMTLSACAWISVTAQSPSPSIVNSRVQYVLLDNDHVLSGTVFRQGNSVVVRRGHEAELTLRAAQVVAVESDLPALYQARIESQRRRSTSTLAQRISDVGWCIDNSLPAHATEALMKVYAVAPNHPVAVQLERRLRRLLEEPTASSSATIATAQYDGDHASEHAIQNASHTETEMAPIPTIQDSQTLVHASAAPAALHAFTARVQPILLARCSQCHHDQSRVATHWNLVLPPGGAMRVTQRGSLANLNATRPFCNPDDPDHSKLLQKATTAHGGISTAKAPIAEHETALADTLKQWIASLNAESQQSPPPARVQAANSVAPATFTTNADADFLPLNPIDPAEVASSIRRPQPSAAALEPPIDQAAQQTLANQDRPSRLPKIDNPNDVEQFNRETRLRRRLGLH